MFKKSSTNKRFDLFNSPSDLMCSCESRVYDNPSAWHKKFYRKVTSNIDEENREFAEQNGIDFVANGIQGKPSRFDLKQTDEHTLEVTDKQTGEVINALPAKDDKWKIQVENKSYKTDFSSLQLEELTTNAGIQSQAEVYV